MAEKMILEPTGPFKSHRGVHLFLVLKILEKGVTTALNLAGVCSLLWKSDILIFKF